MRDATKMEIFGRNILIAAFVSVVAIYLIEFTINPPDLSGVFRVMLTAILLLVAYRGYEVIRWIVALFFITFGLYNFVAAIILFGLFEDVLAFVTAVSGIVHVIAFLILSFNKSARAFLDYQREVAYTKLKQVN